MKFSNIHKSRENDIMSSWELFPHFSNYQRCATFHCYKIYLSCAKLKIFEHFYQEQTLKQNYIKCTIPLH